jgi:hypothetical protein
MFKSQAQRSYMYANHPKMAEEFEKKTPKGKKLPNHVGFAKQITRKEYEKASKHK